MLIDAMLARDRSSQSQSQLIALYRARVEDDINSSIKLGVFKCCTVVSEIIVGRITQELQELGYEVTLIGLNTLTIEWGYD